MPKVLKHFLEKERAKNVDKNKQERAEVVTAMDRHEIKPSLAQAQGLKKMNQAGEVTTSTIGEILAEEKKPPKADKEVSRFKRFFPSDYSPHQMESVITDLLRVWQSEQATAQ